MKKGIKNTLAIFTLLVSRFALGQQITQNFSTNIPMSLTDWNTNTQLPKFDPAQGVLKSVKLNYNGKIETQFAFENRDNLRRSWSANLNGEIKSTLLNTNTGLFQIPLTTTFNDTRSAYDGILDFSGTSGIKTAPILIQDSRSQIYDLSNSSYSYLLNFIGNDNLIFQNTSIARSKYQGPGDYAFSVRTLAGAEQSVDYVYEQAKCARSPGFWKKHLLQMNINRLTIAGIQYNQQQLLNILKGDTISGKDTNSPYLKLARAVVAAKLSIIHINAQYVHVLPIIQQAEAALTGVDLSIKSVNISRQQKEDLLNLKDELEKFNSGSKYNQEGVCKKEDCKDD